MTVTAIINCRGKPGQGAALRDAFIGGIPHSRADAGCEGIDILVNAEAPDHVSSSKSGPASRRMAGISKNDRR